VPRIERRITFFDLFFISFALESAIVFNIMFIVTYVDGTCAYLREACLEKSVEGLHAPSG